MKHDPIPRRQFLGLTLGLSGAALALTTGTAAAAEAVNGISRYNVRDYGAVGNGRRRETEVLQKTIDACAEAGGGTVVFPAGNYLTGTLVLHSHVILHLESGATLLGSTDLADYPPRIPAFRSYTDVNYVERSLIYAEKASHLGIIGQGTIEGQGEHRAFQLGGGRESYKRRPYLIRMIECRNVIVRDITLRNSPMWVQHYLACEDLLIDGITVDSVVNANNDGLDIDGCERVRIANCNIVSGDDAIVLKSTSPRACRGVTITNCVLSSRCNAFKCGTESTGGFFDIAMSNCVIHDTRLSGIALEVVDGGILDGVTINNVRMSRTRGGLFLRLGNRARPYLARGPGGGEGAHVVEEGMKTPGVGRFRNVMISHVLAEGGDSVGCAIAGLPEAGIENVTFDQVRLSFAGGGSVETARRSIAEQPTAYPEYTMFGPLPAYGFYCRHVRGLRFCQVQVACASADHRPSLVCEDVSDLELNGWETDAHQPAATIMVLRSVNGAWIHNCRAPAGTGSYARIEGAQTTGVRWTANNLGLATAPVSLGPGVSPANGMD
jgi:hypothetical protein